MTGTPGKEHWETPFDGVIPTGWLTAYGRTFSDIPYSQEMFDELEQIRVASGGLDVLDSMRDTKLASQFEARHKLIDQLVGQTGIKQVLEVAAGLSTRGIEMTGDSSVRYVEVELPAMAQDKEKIIADLVKKGSVPKRSNLHIESGSAVEREDLQKAAEHFDPDEPLAVVNEGLLRYLSFDDKTRYANNVKALLERFGGVWITTDISMQKVVAMEKDIMPARRKRISELTGINIEDNLFRDGDHAIEFFRDLGFDVEVHSFLEMIDRLTSPAELGVSREYVETTIGSNVAFVMRISQNSE